MEKWPPASRLRRQEQFSLRTGVAQVQMSCTITILVLITALMYLQEQYHGVLEGASTNSIYR